MERRDKRRINLPVRKALASIAEALANELSGANRTDSWLSGIEPRAKVIGILALIFTTTLLHDLPMLAMMFIGVLIVAVSAGLTLKRLGRLWLGVPLFSAAIILPAVLNVVTPGDTLLTLLRLGEGTTLGPWHLPTSIAITDAGLIVASRFIMRTLDCITLSALLVAGTESAVLMNALRRLGMPRVFGMTLAMMQRYLALLLRTAEEIHLAKLSHTMSTQSTRNEHRWVAAGMGVLFSRTYRLAEEVRRAMVSRGYDGDLQVAGIPGLRWQDFIWIAAVILAIAGMFLAERLT